MEQSQSSDVERLWLGTSRAHATTPQGSAQSGPLALLRRRGRADNPRMKNFRRQPEPTSFAVFGDKTTLELAADIATETGLDPDGDEVGAAVLAVLGQWLPRCVGDDQADNYRSAVIFGVRQARMPS